MTNPPRGGTLIVDKGFIYLLYFVPGTILGTANTLAKKTDTIPILKEVSMAAPSIKCQHAVEKDREKTRPAPGALSPLGVSQEPGVLGDHKAGISSPTVTDQHTKSHLSAFQAVLLSSIPAGATILGEGN